MNPPPDPRASRPGPVRTVQIITRLIRAGAQYTILSTARHLDRERFSMEVWCGPQTGVEGTLRREFEDLGVPVVEIPNLVRQIHPVRDLLALGELERRLRARSFDLVHTHTSKAGILGRIAAHRAGVPSIVHTVHGWNFHPGQPAPVRALYVRLERAMARRTDRLVTVTARDIEKGLEARIASRDRYQVIHSGIELDAFRIPPEGGPSVREELGLAPTAIIVGTVGRLAAQKDPFTFLETAARVCRAHPDAVFLWVGDGVLRERVEARIGELGLADRVRLLGLREDVPRLLHAFDIFLLTSIYEGLARVLPEAMAAGKPVVATRVDGTVDAVLPGETGFLAEAGEVEELSDGVLRLVKDAGLRARLGAGGRNRAGETFSARTMTRDLEDLYSELLVPRGGSA